MTNKLISAQEWCDIRKEEIEKTPEKSPCSSKAFYEKIQYNALTHLIFMLPTDNESYQRSKDYAQEMSSSKQFTHEYNSAFCGFRNGQRELKKTLNDAYMQQMGLLDMKIDSRYIESFGFQIQDDGPNVSLFTKGPFTLLRIGDKFSLNEKVGPEKFIEYFNDYTCLTRPELLFLLRNGRVNVITSK